MIKSAREIFNNSFNNEKYNQMLAEINLEFPNQLDFRVAESPIFIDKELKIKLLTVANEIISVIKADDFIEKTNRAIPEKYWTANESEHPEMLALDFAICKNQNVQFEPQLIELQGFPSLFAYQSYLASKYKKHFEIGSEYSNYLNRLNTKSYTDEMGDFLCGKNKENTILLEVKPELQKTRLDFALTEMYWGIKSVCVSKLKSDGKILYYEQEGRKIKIDRIYNRLIFDDLERNYPDLKINIDFKAEYEVEWISHPNWFYRVSKFALPLLKSPFIPETQYLHDLKAIPQDLENYVLKPLFSFAGAGVNVDIEKSDIEKIKDPENYILQKKITYEPCILDPNNELIKTEIRLLYIWPKGQKSPKLMTNLVRLSRGKMIGVDFNKNFDWVGGSVAFIESN